MSDDDRIQAAMTELLHGLRTDGAHHKQHSMEVALRLLMDPATFVAAKNDPDYGWEEGIPS